MIRFDPSWPGYNARNAAVSAMANSPRRPDGPDENIPCQKHRGDFGRSCSAGSLESHAQVALHDPELGQLVSQKQTASNTSSLNS